MTTHSNLIRNRRRYSAGSGFTLVELSVAMAITVVLVMGLVTGLFLQRRALNSQQLINEMNQNARAAANLVTTDLENTGYGLNVSENMAGLWIDWVSGFTSNPTVVDGGSGNPDSVMVAAAFEGKTSNLIVAAAKRDTAVRVVFADIGEFNTTDKKVFFLGKTEVCRITSISGDTLTISTHPTQSRGLAFAHASGEEIEQVQVRTYSLNTDTSVWPFAPYLMMEEDGAIYSSEWEKMIAGNISDFQVRRDGYSTVVEITGRSSDVDVAYSHPTKRDNYRRVTLSRRAFPRIARSKLKEATL